MINHIAIITGNFPTPGAPTVGTFVRQFAREITRQGVSCTVISPVPVHKTVRTNGFPAYSDETLPGSAYLHVYCPRYVSASAWTSLSFLGQFSPTRFTYWQFTAAARRALHVLKTPPEALYGHFLYFGGAAAVRLGQEFQIPAFACAGEGVLWTIDRFGDRVAEKDLKAATGIIANNSHLGQIASERLRYPLEKMCAVPNGADTENFRPREKQSARARFGLPDNTFVVGSVGNFTHEKGVHRVAQAISRMRGVVGAFAGSGAFMPEADNIAFCGMVPHDDMPEFLSACDLFVLPTLVEGSSNATLEAMACGLPVIGSALPFNDDLLDNKMSIRVDPLSIGEIRAAVETLLSDNHRRLSMAAAARLKAESLDISVRVKKLLNFMAARIAEAT